MKTIALVALLLLLPLNASAIEWRTANQVTVAWDAVTTLEDGTTIPAGSTVQYQVFIRVDPGGTPVAGATTNATQAVITLATEGRFHVGIKAQRLVSGQVVSESLIAWSSNVASAAGGNTWGVVYYLPLAPAKNLRTIP
uniref:Uncharacterized protein n=1 Tax=viral metagenome TaxID=1070528 RepID=A0A6M3IGW2_9ZZZZ